MNKKQIAVLVICAAVTVWMFAKTPYHVNNSLWGKWVADMVRIVPATWVAGIAALFILKTNKKSPKP